MKANLRTQYENYWLDEEDGCTKGQNECIKGQIRIGGDTHKSDNDKDGKAYDLAFFSIAALRDQAFELTRRMRALQPAEYNSETLKAAAEHVQAGGDYSDDPVFLYSAILGAIEQIKDYTETMTAILQELEIVERSLNAK